MVSGYGDALHMQCGNLVKIQIAQVLPVYTFFETVRVMTFLLSVHYNG